MAEKWYFQNDTLNHEIEGREMHSACQLNSREPFSPFLKRSIRCEDPRSMGDVEQGDGRIDSLDAAVPWIEDLVISRKLA